MTQPTAASQVLDRTDSDSTELFVIEEDTLELDGSELEQEAVPGKTMALLVHSPDTPFTVAATWGSVAVQGAVTREAEESHTLTDGKKSIELSKQPAAGTVSIKYLGNQGGVTINSKTITARADSTLPLHIDVTYNFEATRILYTPSGDLDADPDEDEWGIDLVFTT